MSGMHALFYPFHLCHERTLHRVLSQFQTLHFRDFMALQLTPLMGTTAFPDRMGDYYPDLLKAGRIRQGHDVSGMMTTESISAVDQDLQDARWRTLFQDALSQDVRFQRGLFPNPKNPGEHTPPTLLQPECARFADPTWAESPFQVESVQTMSRRRLGEEESVGFDYGWALIKTSASLIYTIQLGQSLNLVGVTDSQPHYQLLARTLEREQISLPHSCIEREGY